MADMISQALLKTPTDFLTDVRLRRDVPGSELTTIGCGGPVRQLLEPSTLQSLREILVRSQDGRRGLEIIGGGSNILIPDIGLEGVTLRLGREFAGFGVYPEGTLFSATDVECLEPKSETCVNTEALLLGTPVILFAFGAAPLMAMSRKLSLVGFTGLEFAAGIPASLGGAIKMNAGAHGHSLSELVQAVHICDSNGKLRRLEPAELDFAYRHSNIEDGMVVVAAELKLTKDVISEVCERRNSCLEYRKRTQPLQLPSFGSVFRNPGELGEPGERAAAELIESVGLKGKRSGGVSVSSMHANWIVNVEPSAARTQDVVELIEEAQESVKRSFGISLVPEVVRL